MGLLGVFTGYRIQEGRNRCDKGVGVEFSSCWCWSYSMAIAASLAPHIERLGSCFVSFALSGSLLASYIVSASEAR